MSSEVPPEGQPAEGQPADGQPVEGQQPQQQPWGLANQPAAGYKGHIIRPRGLLSANSPLRMRTDGTAPAASQFSVLAIVALILGIFIPPAGIVCGHIALSRIRKFQLEGRGLALVGTILGYVLTVIWGILIVLAIVFFTMRLGPSNWQFTSY